MDENPSGAEGLAKNDPYRGMERSDIRPDFLDVSSQEGGDEGVGDKIGKAEQKVKDGARNTFKRAEGMALEAGKAALTGGTSLGATAAAKGAEKGAETATKAASAAASKKKGDGKDDGKLKLSGKGSKGALALIALFLLGFAVISFLGQSLMAFGIVARLTQQYNSTSISASEKSDVMLNMQLSASRSNGSKYGSTPFDNDAFGLSSTEQQALAEFGIDYKDEDGTRALTYVGSDGETYVVVSDDTVSTGVETIASSETAGDVISDEELISAKKREVLANLKLADVGEGNVISVSEALKRTDFKDLYFKGSASWRGTISGWFNSMTETVRDRIGWTRNRYDDWKASGSFAEDEKKFEDEAKNKHPSEVEFDDGSKTFEERVRNIAEKSSNNECGTMSAFMDIHGVVAAQQKAEQQNASSGYLEAIQKTQAGKGTEAPLNVYNKKMTESGIGGASAMTSEGMKALFSSSGKINQDNQYLLEVSTEANSLQTVSFSSVDEEEYKECTYEDNVIETKGGFISLIGSAFKKAWAKVTGFLFGTAPAASADVVVSALDPTIKKYETAVARTYMVEDLGKPLGDAVVSSGQQLFNEVAKGYGQSIMDEAETLAFLKVQEEVIAEQADFERRNLSPFDISSQYTFLGSLAYSVIPVFATAESTSVISSVMNGLSSLTSGAVVKLLPTSSAISNTEILNSRGECAVADKLGSVSNGFCNQYYGTDFDLIRKDPIALYEYIVETRYDHWSYIRSVDEADYHGIKHVGLGSEAGPINSAENSLSNYWPKRGEYGEGTPNGCEFDWESETRYWNDGTPYTYYFWDEPIAWKYTHATNFLYKGYANGNAEDEIGKAVNDEDPGQCMLDIDYDSENNPKINMNSSLGLYLLAAGQRDSNWGSADSNITEKIASIEYNFGRVAKKSKTNQAEDTQGAAANPNRSKRIGGSTYVATELKDNIYMDNEMLDNESVHQNAGWVSPAALFSNISEWHFWMDEHRYYQAYVEWQGMMETTAKLKKSSVATAVDNYYAENPLDQSYEGRIARMAGLSKSETVAILDLFNYMEWLAQYDPSELGPVPVEKTKKTIEYDNEEVIATAEGAIVAKRMEFEREKIQAVTA